MIRFETIALAMPQYEFRCFLMLADKSSTASVDGLNQLFRVRREGKRVKIDLAPGAQHALGQPILTAVPVDGQVDEIVSGTVSLGGTPTSFATAVAELSLDPLCSSASPLMTKLRRQ